MAATRSEAADALRLARSDLLAHAEVRGPQLRESLTSLYDGWLSALFRPVEGVALVAVGGLGRREPAPYGDLDLVLVHTGRRGIAAVAEAIWYPVWDTGLGLDHSVRTIAEARAIAEQDVKAAQGLLDARCIAGDAGLAAELRTTAHAVWRASVRAHLPQLHQLAQQRRHRAGELAFLLEPDLKDSAGGIRDCLILHALAAAQLTDEPGAAVQGARELLLDVRGELQRRLARGSDRLVQQEQSPLAAALGLQDSDELLRAVSEAGRTIGYAADSAWRRVHAEVNRRGLRRSRRRRERQPLAAGVVEQDGEVVLARGAEPAWDPGLLLRAAAAAALAGLPLSPHTLLRLQAEAPPMPTPWPAAGRDSFIKLLGAGHDAVPVVEALDQFGLLSRLLPEWERIRCRPQRNPVHRFTVDRHLVETAAEGAALTREVARPDLLLLGCLLHDIGKGSGGDHSVEGARTAEAIATRIGLSPTDADIVVRLVRHHLLLPDTATRRDIDEPVIQRAVAAAVGDSAEVLDLLHALTRADARATGPGAWSDWKAGLVSGLVERVHATMTGAPPPAPPRLPAQRLGAAAPEPTAVRLDGDELLVVAPDTPGLLSRTAGLLAVHSLDVRSATITTEAGHAVNLFVVAPRFGRTPDVGLLGSDLEAILAGRFPLAQRLAAQERAYPAARGEPARVLWFDDESTHATIVELRAGDSVGLLHRVTAALERCGADVRSARVSTLGASVVDAFYVLTAGGDPVIEPALRSDIERALLAATGGVTDG